MTIEIGGYRIDPVMDGQGRLPATEFFPDTSPAEWERHCSLVDDESRVTIAVGALLARGHDRTVLVDLGYGPGALGDIATGHLVASLRSLGVEPGDVTDVVFTHLHRDHVGWASVEGEPQFPHATFRCPPADLVYFVEEGNDPSVRELLGPCEGQVEALDDQSSPLPGVIALSAPGHTPGSTVVVFSAGAHRAIVLGDVVHCPVQLLEPEWSTLNDVDPELARRTRQRVVRELEGDEAALMAGMHFPGLRFGRLLTGEAGRRWMV